MQKKTDPQPYLVAKNPQIIMPCYLAIKNQQYMRYLSLWFVCVLGLYVEEFKAQYISQLGRICSASATANACITVELWGQYSDSASFKSKKIHETIY
jgi:hypothetical protein